MSPCTQYNVHRHTCEDIRHLCHNNIVCCVIMAREYITRSVNILEIIIGASVTTTSSSSCIHQHTSAYVSIRMSLRQQTTSSSSTASCNPSRIWGLVSAMTCFSAVPAARLAEVNAYLASSSGVCVCEMQNLWHIDSCIAEREITRAPLFLHLHLAGTKISNFRY
jgi:hypothetical protein